MPLYKKCSFILISFPSTDNFAPPNNFTVNPVAVMMISASNVSPDFNRIPLGTNLNFVC